MSFNRLFKGHAPRKSAVSKTAEREFEREVKKLEQLDEDAKKLYKDMKRCVDAQNAQSRFEVKMTQDLLNSPLCKEDEELRNNVEAWNMTAQRLETLMQEHSAVCQKCVCEPMKKFTTIYPSVQTAVKKWEQSRQEYTKCQAKLEKYQDKERTGGNIVKLDSSRKALHAAKEDFERQNLTLMEEMPRLYEGRIDYFQPSFHALIKSQVHYYTACHKLYSELSARMNGDQGDIPSDEYTSGIQQKLAEILSLSITVDK